MIKSSENQEKFIDSCCQKQREKQLIRLYMYRTIVDSGDFLDIKRCSSGTSALNRDSYESFS
jgi:hypothetical protein